MIHIVVRDIHEDEMSIYNPEGECIVVTRNMLCVNDILLQIKEHSLEGYYVKVGNNQYEISKKGRIKGPVGITYATQLRKLMGF